MKLAPPITLPDELRHLLPLVGVSGLVALALVAVAMLLGRAIAPAAVVSSWLLLGVGMLTVLLAVGLRELAALPLATRDSRRLPIAVLATLVMALVLGVLAVPPTSAAVVSGLLIVILGEQFASWWLLLHGDPFPLPRWRMPLTTPSNAPESPAKAHAISADDCESEELLPADVLQQLTRSRGETGGEVIYGLLRAEFRQGERQQWLSIAFCPPLAARPRCTAHFAEGTSGVLEIEEVETYGVRLMIRLPQPVRMNQSVLVELFAEA